MVHRGGRGIDIVRVAGSSQRRNGPRLPFAGMKREGRTNEYRSGHFSKL